MLQMHNTFKEMLWVCNINELAETSKVCRVSKVIRPYLEAIS